MVAVYIRSREEERESASQVSSGYVEPNGMTAAPSAPTEKDVGRSIAASDTGLARLLGHIRTIRAV